MGLRKVSKLIKKKRNRLTFKILKIHMSFLENKFYTPKSFACPSYVVPSDFPEESDAKLDSRGNLIE